MYLIFPLSNEHIKNVLILGLHGTVEPPVSDLLCVRVRWLLREVVAKGGSTVYMYIRRGRILTLTIKEHQFNIS